jgi:hypothetical protein
MANEKVIVYDSGSVAMGSVTTFGIPAITLMSGMGTVANAGGLLQVDKQLLLDDLQSQSQYAQVQD